MKLEQLDTLHTLTTVENDQNKDNSNSQLLEREPVPNTPFHIIGANDKGYFLALGRYRLTEIRADKTAVLDELQGNMWNIIMNLVISISQDIEEIRKSEN